MLSSIVFVPKAQAATGINQQINYQGRLLTIGGAVVPDGTYNMEFKIYQDGPGNVANDTGGTLKWTEDWVYGVNSPDNRVTIRNGYFSVALGSICSFASTTCTASTGNSQTNAIIDWNQDTLWMSVNIGNLTTAATFAGAGGDGEMLPMRRMSSAIYAMNANKVGGLTASQLVQLSPAGQQTGFINVSGTVNGLTLTVNSLAAATAATNLAVNAGTTGQVQIGGTSTGDILLGGGSLSTGCTLTNNSGNLDCTGAINGATIATTTFNGLTISATNLAVVAAATNLTINAGTTGQVQIGGTSTGDILLGGGVGATGCTLTNSNGNLVCAGSVSATSTATGTGTQALASNLYVQSRGQNLITNGSGLMGNNYNFSSFTFDSVETHGGGGSFLKNVSQQGFQSDELIPVDITKRYREVGWGKSGDNGGGNYNAANRQYLALANLDADGNNIGMENSVKFAGSTDTTLAAPLNPGNTTVTLTNATGWYNGATSSSRVMSWYGYTNSKGYTYPNYTYTRNVTGGDAWAAGGISGNVITLTTPWSGPALSAGAAVRNSPYGGTYKYITSAANTIVPNTWTKYEGYIDAPSGSGLESTNEFRAGTAYVRLVFLVNYHGAADNNIRWSDLSLSEMSANNLEVASATQVGVVNLSNQTLGSGDKYFGGNVGIGTTAPGTKLSVYTATDTAGASALRVSGGTGGVAGSGATIDFFTGQETNPMGRITTDNQFSSGIGNSKGKLILSSYYNAYMNELTLWNGNVGIGTSNPQTLLDVGAHLANNVSAAAAINGNMIAGAATSAVMIGYGGNDIQGRTGTGLTSNGNLSLNPYGGNVGIGDATPAAMLTVGSGDLFQVNSSGAIAASTAIANSGAYVQSGSSANTFSGATTFSAAATGLAVTNNATVGGTLAVTSTVTGGTYNAQTISSAANFTGSLTVTAGATTINQTADDATFTGFVTNDSGVLKYRTSAQVSSDLNALTKTSSTLAGPMTTGNWYRIATSSGGGQGRGAAKVILSNGGGTGTPDQATFQVAKDYSTNGSISMLSQNGTSCFDAIRMVDSAPSAVNTYIDVRAAGACTSLYVTVVNEESSFGNFTANAFTAPAGGTEVTLTTLDLSSNTLFGISRSSADNLFRIQPNSLLSGQSTYNLLTTTTGAISVGSATSTLAAGNILTVAGNTTLGDAATDTLTVRGLATLSDSSSTYPLRFGADVDLYRGSASRLDLGAGDSLNLILGQIMTDNGNLSVLTTGSAATGIRANGLLLGSSYDSTPLVNEIRSTSGQNLLLNSRGAGNIYLQTADSTKLTVLNNGNIGIGNTSPAEKLDIGINDSTDKAIKVSYSTVPAYITSSYDGTSFAYNGISNNFRPTGNTYTTSGNTNYGNLLFSLKSSTGTASKFVFSYGAPSAGVPTVSDVMTILGTGNVGIGDTSPAAMLTVGSGDLFQVNSSGAIAASTAIANSGAYVQSGSSANTFSGATTFSAAATGLAVTNNATVGGTLTVSNTITTNAGTNTGLIISNSSGGPWAMVLSRSDVANSAINIYNNGGTYAMYNYAGSVNTMNLTQAGLLSLPQTGGGLSVSGASDLTGILTVKGGGTLAGAHSARNFISASDIYNAGANGQGFKLNSMTNGTNFVGWNLNSDWGGRLSLGVNVGAGAAANSPEQLTIISGGNVGINTNAPNYKLEVNGGIGLTTGGSTNRKALTPTNFGYSASYRSMMLGSTSTNYNVADGAVTLSLNYDPSVNANSSFSGDGSEIIVRNGAKFITPNDANTAWNLNTLVLKDGNIGVGIAPSTRLHVAATSADAITRISTFTSGNPILQLNAEGSNGGSIEYRRSGSLLALTNGGTDILFGTTTGFVGIGDSTPASMLTVGSGDLFQVNSSGAIAASTAMANSGAYVQSGVSANTFSGATTFSAAATGLAVTNNATVGGTLGVTTSVSTPVFSVNAAEGNGLKFWAGSDTYKISMGVTAGEYQYGPVTDYSIKSSMGAGAGRGFTWGQYGVTPIAALNSTSGNMQIAGTFTSGLINGQTITSAANFTGSLAVASNLTVDTNSLYVDSTNNRLGVGTTTPNTTLDVLGATSRSENSVRSYTTVYSYSDGNNPDTGTFKIVMPKTWSSTMIQMKISGYDYSGAGAWEVIVGGYNYAGSSAWINTSAEIRGNAPFTSVRLAHDGTKNVILLGTTATTWLYPKISITDFTAGHSNIDDWGSGWSGSFIVSETGITSITTPTVRQTTYTSNTFIQGGNSFGASGLLGTNDAQSLLLETNNTTRLTIDSAGAATFAGTLTVNGTQLTNLGATLNTTSALGDLAAGALGTAANTVDKYTSFTIAPTASGRTYTIPSPTATTAGRIIYITNISGTYNFIIGSDTFGVGNSLEYVWSGSAWQAVKINGTGSGVTTIGTFSGSSQTNGASISSNTITFGPADGTNPGMVTTGTQTLAGAKTFTGAALFKNASDSSAAFQVQTAGSVVGMNYDTTNQQLSIRNKSDSGSYGSYQTVSCSGTDWSYLSANNYHTTGATGGTLSCSSPTATIGTTYELCLTKDANYTDSLYHSSFGGVSGPVVGDFSYSACSNITATSTASLSIINDWYDAGDFTITLRSINLQSSSLAVKDSTGANVLEVRTNSTNMAIGLNSLANNFGGSNNTAFGKSTLAANTTGGNNTAIGYQSLISTYGGSNNTALGFNSLYSNNSGSYNLGLGDSADVVFNNLSHASAIGAGSLVASSNSLVLGRAQVNGANGDSIGINTSYPNLIANTALHVGNGSYNTGVICQTTAGTSCSGGSATNIVYGYNISSPTFTPSMVGGKIIYGDGTTANIITYNSSTSITVDVTKLISTVSLYTIIYPGGFNVSTAGKVTSRVLTDSTTAFQIQNAAGTALMTVDSSTAGGSTIFNTTSATAGATVISIAQSGTVQGTITVNGATVSYNAFTGSHYVQLMPGQSVPDYGKLMSFGPNSTKRMNGNGELIYNTQESQIANDPNAFGSFNGQTDGGLPETYGHGGLYLVSAAGNGDIWVADNGSGNISTGDPLISSTLPGYAMRDNKTFATSHIFAKAAENVNWNNVTTTVNGTKVIKLSILYSFYDQNNTTGMLQGQNLNIAADGYFGGDVSVSGKLNISGHTTLSELTVTGNATFTGNLTVQNISMADITVNGHIITAGNTPLLAIGNAAGIEDLLHHISAPSATIDGNDTSGTITIVAGASTVAGELAKITFNKPFGKTPKVVLVGLNKEGSKLQPYFDDNNITATGITASTEQIMETGKTYKFSYWINE